MPFSDIILSIALFRHYVLVDWRVSKCICEDCAVPTNIPDIQYSNLMNWASCVYSGSHIWKLYICVANHTPCYLKKWWLHVSDVSWGNSAYNICCQLQFIWRYHLKRSYFFSLWCLSCRLLPYSVDVCKYPTLRLFLLLVLTTCILQGFVIGLLLNTALLAVDLLFDYIG